MCEIYEKTGDVKGYDKRGGEINVINRKMS